MRIYTNVSTCACEHLKVPLLLRKCPTEGRNSADEEGLGVVVVYILYI